MSTKSGLTFGKVLGQGAFGNVVEGSYNGKDVAIKILHSPISTECNQMLNVIVNLNHRNVSRLLAILDVGQSKCAHLIFLKASRGNLLEYVKGIEENALEPLKKGMLNKFAIDIINGMEYLHQMNIIHGNLAARNVLLHQHGDYLNAIVTDYGLNQVIEGQGSNYFKRKQERAIPIRWVPYECISTNQYLGVFSSASDVWSFGVVLWESWTRGDIPYGAATSNTEARQHILNGSSPLAFFRPFCPIDVANVMESIFKKNPEERPTFSELGKTFQEIRNQHRKKQPSGIPQNVQCRTSRQTDNAANSKLDSLMTKTSRSRSQKRQTSVPCVQNQATIFEGPMAISGYQTNGNNRNPRGHREQSCHVPEAPPPYTPSTLVPVPLMDFAGAVPQAIPHGSYAQSHNYSAHTNMEMEQKVLDLKQQISNLEIKKLEQQVQNLQETVEADKRQGGSNHSQKNPNRGHSQYRNQQRRYTSQRNKNQQPENNGDCSIV